MKNKKCFKRILCAVLCLCLCWGSIVALASCDGSGNGGSEEETIQVLRYCKDLAVGDKVVTSAIETVTVAKKIVPEGIITAETEAIGKFAIEQISAGEFVVSQKLAKTKPVEEKVIEDDYIIVTDHIKLTSDVSTGLQKLIDENPNRTLYFPDGTYYIGKTIKTSSEPSKSVSFMCSTYAIFTPSSNWQGALTDPLFDLGGAGESKTMPDKKVGNETFFKGGTINCANQSSAMEINGTGRVLVQNLSIKNSQIGITVNSDYNDLDNIVLTGTNNETSIGMLINSSYNTLTNMRIYRINTGIKLTGGKNVLRNLHPLYSGKFTTSCGFWDVSEGNFYDICYSDHFATGFRLGDNTVSILNGSFAYWYNNGYDKNGVTKVSHEQHWGFATEGRFNSVIRSARVDLNYDNCDSTFMHVEQSGGNGIVLDPVCGGANISGRDDHKSEWTPYLKGEIHS